MSNLNENLSRDIFILENENNATTSQVNRIWPTTVLDQVFDQTSPTKKTLRELLADLKQEILTGGAGNIIFPVTSVNEQTEDVIITPATIGLGRVDNTRDIDKPLSTPQRSAVMDILAGYDFKINMDELYNHISDYTNPHAVNIDQINKDGELTNFVSRMITAHCLSEERLVHIDIRRSLSKLWTYVDDNINGGLERRIENVLGIMDDHIKDPIAHLNIFETKESLSNKSVGFTKETGNHIKYPSTRAVVEYVDKEIRDFGKTIPDIKDYISDIKSVANRNDLPPADAISMRSSYIIRNGNGSQNEIAVCRMNPNGSYAWDISEMGSISKFNSYHFEDTVDGLSIKMDSIIDTILTKTGDMDTTLSNILRDYYTKDEIENRFLRDVEILSGTMDGHIRYYLNGDPSTMSDDIAIPGLKNLAFLEWVTEREIEELAIHNRHLLSRSVDSRVIAKKSVKFEHLDDSTFHPGLLKTPKGTMLGNIMNDDGTVHSVNLVQLGDLLRPIIGGWPDINIPGIDTSLPELSPLMWEVGTENVFLDGSVGVRFTGAISVLPNKLMMTLLSDKITSDKFQLMDAGGYWRTDSDAGIDALIGGTNMMGNTFAAITMTKEKLELSTISIGNRFEAPFDIWVRYMPLKRDDSDRGTLPDEV